MNVTIVDEELPYPPVSGKRIRILNLAVHLTQRHQITFLCHRNADQAEARQGEAFLNARGIKTLLVDRERKPLTPTLDRVGFCSRIARNMFSPVPFSVQWNDCPRLHTAVARHASTEAVDIWQCEWAPYATALMSTDLPWVMMAHDIQSLIWERYYRSTRIPFKRWYIQQQWKKYRGYERRVFSQAPLTITVTEQDARRAATLFGAGLTSVVDNGVDVAHYQSRDAQRGVVRRHNEILFLGNLEWRANIDAVRLLLDEIFPQVLAAEPTARLCIVGRRPPSSLRRRIEQTRHAELHSDVADVRPFLYRSGMMAVPLRIGGGSRLKILEAMACGLPVVSTSVGAEGLRLKAGDHFSQAESSAEMASALVESIRIPEAALKQARAGQAVIENHYDWGALAEKMELAWNILLQGCREPSLAAGALRHG